MVAVVLLIVLKGNDSSEQDTDGGKLQTIVVDKDGEPVGGIRELTYNKGEQILFKVKSDVADEVHVHGYDIDEGRPKARRLGHLRLPGRRSKASSRPSSRVAKNRSSN